MIDPVGFPTRILIVDDKASVREALAMRIASQDGRYQTWVAGSGERALERLAEQDFDIVLCDLMLRSGMDGVTLTKRISELHPEVRVVVFSGRDMGARKKEVLLAGALFYLSKPIDFDELLHAIDKIQAIRGTETQNRWFEQLTLISYDLQASFSPERIAKRIVQGACELGYRRARLYLRDSDKDQLVGQVAAGMDDNAAFVGYEIPLVTAPMIHHIFNRDRPTFWDRHSLEEIFGPEVHESWLKDFELQDIVWLDCPLMVGQKRVGTLAVDYGPSNEGHFSENDRQIMGIFSNLAAQALHNSRLYEKEALAKASLQSILRDAPDAVITTDLDGTINFVSPSSERILQRLPSELLKRPAAQVYCDEKGTEGSGREVAREVMRHLRQDGTLANHRVYMRDGEGRPRPISVSVSLLRDDDGRAIGTLGFLKNLGPIEEQTQAYQDLLQGFGYGTLLLGARGNIGFVNRKAARLLSRPRRELEGSSFVSLIRPAQRQDFKAALKEVLDGGAEKGLDLSLSRPGGRWLPIKAILTPARLGGSRAPGVAVALHDKSELEALIRSGRLMALGQMVAGVGHEINNPLNQVLLAAREIEEELALTEPALDELPVLVDMIVRNGIRISSIVKQLREFARPGEMKQRSLDVNALVRGSMAFFASRFRNHRIDTVLELEDDLPRISGHPARLQQVLVNLIVNAEEAMDEVEGPRRITIGTRRVDEGHLAITVQDSGPGVPDAIRDAIFDPFYTTKPPNRGTGLGLSISKSIVETHGGVIKVEEAGSVASPETSASSGALFTVVLPVDDSATREAEE